MRKFVFIVAGTSCTIVVLAGLAAALLKHSLLSLLLIVAGGLAFWPVLKKAKKESWFGKPHGR